MQSKKRALGKGLSALLPQKPASAPEHIITAATAPHHEPDTPTGAHVLQLPTEALTPNPLQPRHTFDDSALEELAASVKTHGVLQPILVTKQDNRYVIIAGERRWRAAQRAGLPTVPAIVRDVSNLQALEFALIENLQREDLNPIEEARAYQVLADDFGLSQEQIAERVNKSRPAVANALRLLNLPPDIQADIEAGLLSAGHARALLALPSEEEQRRWRDTVLAQGLSVRELEQAIQRSLERTPRPKPRKRQADNLPEPALRALRERFEEVLACRVQISMSGADRGKVEIYFSSLDELDRIKEALGIGES